MKEFIEFVTTHLVDKPEEVHVNEIVGQQTNVLELRVGDGDMGKVIGRHGKTAGAIRTLLDAIAAKQRRRVVLEILDGNADGQKKMKNEKPNENTTTQKPVLETHINGEGSW